MHNTCSYEEYMQDQKQLGTSLCYRPFVLCIIKHALTSGRSSWWVQGGTPLPETLPPLITYFRFLLWSYLWYAPPPWLLCTPWRKLWLRPCKLFNLIIFFFLSKTKFFINWQYQVRSCDLHRVFIYYILPRTKNGLDRGLTKYTRTFEKKV